MASLDPSRPRAARFKVELDEERQRCSETSESMPQASLKHERQEILEQIQQYDLPNDESVSPSRTCNDPVQTFEPAIHAPVPRHPPYVPLGLEDAGRNSVTAYHRSGHAHPRSSTVHPCPAPLPRSSNPDSNMTLDVADRGRRSSCGGKRGTQEQTGRESSARKQLPEKASVHQLSCPSRRPFLLPKSPDGSFAEQTTNTALCHHGTSSPLFPFRPTTPTPYSPPNRSGIGAPGICESGRNGARRWYSMTPRPDQLNLHRSLPSLFKSDPRGTPELRPTVVGDNDKPIFTEDQAPSPQASSLEQTLAITDTNTFNAQVTLPIPLVASHHRVDVVDFGNYTRSATATFASRPSHVHGKTVGSTKLIKPPQIGKICATLMDIFCDSAKYKKFLSYRDRAAQSLLNFLQTLLDYSQLEEGFRTILFVALLRLTRKSDLYPECFALKDVTRDGEHPVADGRYGEIYKGYFQGRLVCVKVVRMYEKSDKASLYKAFSREAVLWGQLSHTNVLPFYGICRLEDARQRIGLVSPWMENGNINEFLKRNTDADRRLLVMDVAAGMSYLHNHRVTHGDLKGSNILVTESGRACLADFGFSSVIDSQGLKTASLSSATAEGGTMRFQAPELIDPQFECSRSQASDIYAFALVCYEIFTGDIPFYDIPNSFTVMLKVTRGERPSRPLGLIDLGLNDVMWRLMEDCWEHNPNRRPTAIQIVRRLPRIPDTRPGACWSRVRASTGHGLANSQGFSVVETLRVLEADGVLLF